MQRILQVTLMPRVKLNLEDIEPMQNALQECVRHGYGGFYYKGEFWDWRMGKYALDDLKARRDGYADEDLTE